MHGSRTPIENKANALADYLYSKYWSPIAHPPALENRPKLIHNDLPYDTLDITTEEVESANDKLGTNKALGPDGWVYHRTVQISGPRQYSKLDRMFQRFLAPQICSG